MASEFLVGVDVGSDSVRAMLLEIRPANSETGNETRPPSPPKASGRQVGTSSETFLVRAVHSKPIKTWQSPELPPLHIEQSSENIWQAVCATVREVVETVPGASKLIKGLAFCATCSLVACDKTGLPVSVSTSGKDEQNVLKWCDHRAENEAKEISSLKSAKRVLRFTGGSVSPEMDIPKARWLVANTPKEILQRIDHLMSLPDWLTFRATGKPLRSFNSLVCKWNFIGFMDDSWRELGKKDGAGPKMGWDDEFLKSAGLEMLGQLDRYRRIGAPNSVLSPEDVVGTLRDQETAAMLGLPLNVKVAASLIDAHCGALGILAQGFRPGYLHGSSLALVAGTSACHVIFSGNKPIFVPGVWSGAIGPKLFFNEAGVSSAGQFLNFIIDAHPARGILDARFAELKAASSKGKCACPTSRFELLEQILEEGHIASPDCDHYTKMSRHIHLTPDINGNRSPFARPEMRGVLSGLRLEVESALVDVATMYLAAVQSLAYSSKMIINRLNAYGHIVDRLSIAGGLAKSKLFVQTHADVLDPILVVTPAEEESVLFGACILALVCTQKRAKMEDLLERAGNAVPQQLCEIEYKANPLTAAFHQKKYQVFQQLCQMNKTHYDIMSSVK